MPSEPLLSVGDKLTLTCTFVDCAGNINCTFYWLLDGSPVEPSLVTVVNTTTSRLSVNSVTSANFGTYTCQVTSACGMGTAVAYVRERGNLDICIPAACTFTPPGNSTLWQSHLYAYLSLVRGSAVYCTLSVVVWKAVLLCVLLQYSKPKAADTSIPWVPSTCPLYSFVQFPITSQG